MSAAREHDRDGAAGAGGATTRDAARAALRRPAAARQSERGVALLLALLTMVLLTVVVIEFTVSSQVDYRRSVMWANGRRAALVADGGVMLAGEVLHEDAILGDTDSLTDIWARELPPIDTGAGMLAVRIEDETAKLNLNELAAGALSPSGRRFTSLLQKLNLDPQLAIPVADWVDRNRDPGPGSLAAEDDWYLSNAKPPYTARNGALRSFAELALVRGFTPEILSKLRRYVTVLPDVSGKVNVNTALPEVLMAMDPRLDDSSTVQKLVEARTVKPFEKVDELATTGGLEAIPKAELERLFAFSSSWFRVRSTGDVDGAMRSEEALLKRDSGSSKILYLLPRRGPNIVGLDSGVRGRLDDAGLLGASRR